MALLNKQGLPITAQLAIESLEYSKGEGVNLSATETALSPRIRAFRHLYKDVIKQDVSDRIYMLLGSLTHKILEGTARELAKDNPTHTLEAIASVLSDFNDGKITPADLPKELERRTWEAIKLTVWEDHKVMIERRLFAELDGWVISGQPDLYMANEQHGDDYKLCSVYNHILGTKRDWEIQQNVYKWLLFRNGFEVKSWNIHAIFRDFMKSKARWDPTYPQRGWIPYDVNLWSIEAIEEYLSERIALHKEGEAAEDPETLPLCTPEERWSSNEQWAATKASRKRAIKLFDNEDEARIWIRKNQKENEHLVVEHRPGEDRRCIGNYCEVADFCSHGKNLRAGAAS